MNVFFQIMATLIIVLSVLSVCLGITISRLRKRLAEAQENRQHLTVAQINDITRNLREIGLERDQLQSTCDLLREREKELGKFIRTLIGHIEQADTHLSHSSVEAWMAPYRPAVVLQFQVLPETPSEIVEVNAAHHSIRKAINEYREISDSSFNERKESKQ